MHAFHVLSQTRRTLTGEVAILTGKILVDHMSYLVTL